jgi:hypothetical protein
MAFSATNSRKRRESFAGFAGQSIESVSYAAMGKLYSTNRIMPDTVFPAPAGAQEDAGDLRTHFLIVSVSRAPASRAGNPPSTIRDASKPIAAARRPIAARLARRQLGAARPEPFKGELTPA